MVESASPLHRWRVLARARARHRNGTGESMISEWRKLTFSADELARAVMSYLLSTRGIGKDDRLGDIVVKNAPGTAVSVSIFSPSSPDPREIELKPEVIAALLVAHCIRNKTPLPRRAQKSIAVDGDRLCLMLELA
jgi:hypothetical protein